MTSQFVLLLSALAAAGADVSPAPRSERPNVVIFLADDQGWGDLSASGNGNLNTPNIDSLATSGASFDRFFVCPVCAPTRAEFLTGRYHPRGGVSGVSTGQERLNTDERTLADIFLGAGYATAAFGKWHNGSQWPYHPNARGFQEYYGFTSGHWGEYFDPPLDHNGQPVRGQGYVADDFTDHALSFIEQNRQRPFFCYLAFNTPHSPFAVPEEYWQRFRETPITQRAASGEEDLDVTRCALAMCENLDWNVGRVLRRLEQLQLADNTLVLYFSDNGPNSWRFNGGMRGRKGSTDEGGVRSPLFLRWPARIQPGSKIQEIAAAIDLLPTLASLTGIPVPEGKPLDGVDLSPLLLGRGQPWPERKIFSHWNGRVSVRTQRHRLDDRGALFDMASDPGQRTDIARQQPELAAELAAAVAAWRRDVLPPAPPAKPGAAGKPGPKLGPKKSPRVVDNRPYPVGFSEFPRTPLPARDATARGGIRRSASAPNCSYFVHWTALEDSITWDIAVNTRGIYEVEIQYTCPPADAGSTVELSFGGSRVAGRVEPGWDPPLYTNQDTLPRPAAESQMKEFRSLRLGELKLEKGRGPLTLRALEIPGNQVMDVRQVNLTLKTSPSTQ